MNIFSHRIKFVIIFCLFIGFSFLAGGYIAPRPQAATTAQATDSSALPGWNLVWNDEFNGPEGNPPDQTKWEYDLGGHGWGNNELQYYTSHPTNVATNGEGSLVITANEVDKHVSSGMDCWYGPCQFTSARLLTKGKFAFTYGRIEARMKLPHGQGMWTGFWMMGANIDQIHWPNSGEIDIIENIGKEPDIVHGTVHGPGYSGQNSIGQKYTLPSGEFADDFHVFAVEWEPEEIRWYVDDHQYFSVTPDSVTGEWVFNHPFFILINLAIGGRWPGSPDHTTVFPQPLQIDFIRVYEQIK